MLVRLRSPLPKAPPLESSLECNAFGDWLTGTPGLFRENATSRLRRPPSSFSRTSLRWKNRRKWDHFPVRQDPHPHAGHVCGTPLRASAGRVGGPQTYLNVTPSRKSLEKARDAIREKTVPEPESLRAQADGDPPQPAQPKEIPPPERDEPLPTSTGTWTSTPMRNACRKAGCGKSARPV